VLHEKIGDLSAKIQVALTKLGIGIIVLTPVAKLKAADGAEISLEVPVVVQVQENVTINQGASGTKLAALDVVIEILTRLHFWSHGLNAGPRDFRWSRRMKLHSSW